MTRLRKIALVALIAIIGTSMLFAQGAKEEAKAGAPIELRVLNYLDLAQANSADEVAMVWEKYYAEHPEVHITREDQFNEAFHQKTESYITAGKVPEVVYMFPGGRSESLFVTNSIQDLTPWLERDGLLDMYNPATLVPQVGGIIGELPSGLTASHMLYVNNTVLDKYNLDMPETLQDLIDMVPVLSKDNVQVIAMDNQAGWVMQSCLFSALVGRYGGLNWYEDLKAGKIDFQDDWFVNALAAVNTLYETGVLSRASLNSPYTASRGDFVSDKAAFYIDGDWATGGFMTDSSTGVALLSPERQANDFVLTVFPALPGEVVHNTTSGTVATGFGLNADLEMGTPEGEAAWELIKYLQGEYVQSYRLKTGAGFPSYLGIDIDAFIEENNLEPFVGKRYDFYNQVEGTTPVCDSVLSPAVANIINIGLQEIGLGVKTPEQVAADVQAAYDLEK